MRPCSHKMLFGAIAFQRAGHAVRCELNAWARRNAWLMGQDGRDLVAMGPQMNPWGAI